MLTSYKNNRQLGRPFSNITTWHAKKIGSKLFTNNENFNFKNVNKLLTIHYMIFLELYLKYYITSYHIRKYPFTSSVI